MLDHGLSSELIWFSKFIWMMIILFLVLLLLAENRRPYFIEVNYYWKEGEKEQPNDEKGQTFEEDEQTASPGSVRGYGACSFCGKLSTITTSCSRCKAALYCSEVCHVIHERLWHKYECIEILTAADQERPAHGTSKSLQLPEKESSCSSDEEEQITDVGGVEYIEEKAEQPSLEPMAKPLIRISQETTEKSHETAEQVRNLKEELAKFKNENISLQSERDNWEMRAKDAADRSHSFMKESEHQLLILKHENELISNAEKQARDMVHSLSERLHSLQIAEEKRVAEMRKQEEYKQMIQNECTKAKRELQEEQERVRRLTLERDQAAQFAKKLDEETGQKLVNALNAVAAAESRAAAAAAEVIRTDNLSRNSTFHNKQACAICLSHEKDMAFGCGHMTCRDCGSRISKCPICREQIKSRVKLFPG